MQSHRKLSTETNYQVTQDISLAQSVEIVDRWSSFSKSHRVSTKFHFKKNPVKAHSDRHRLDSLHSMSLQELRTMLNTKNAYQETI